ncbi:actin bundling protein [Heterostelium album PN500]|uniref:Actin bundling protein n=1 Tax=Heterostelium pallidum (strain ATCC 26659 / Pp 5 / PN500) TaxID=670386 RepID=D3B3N6_HETP5|nr:actin bundling protein [Heterostelium album PN500]EFA83934.1 actin bundling protein [Heterostelium album PN500]|eukprot:XP_020436051.1 actin bundling protein [Heterostelium album PN500]
MTETAPKVLEGINLSKKGGASFTEKLDAEALKFFNEVASTPFSQQAVAFLNAYWVEVNSEKEFIYSVAWETMKYADMHSKGVQLVYKYDEGNDLDFDIGLYFYEQLCKFCEDPKNSQYQQYARSLPTMLTALKRKQELRDKVDVNFDGRISFLEYLLYQYQDVANPADFCTRSMGHDEHPEIKKARLALEEVNKRIRAYEEEKARLTAEAESGTGVKALGAKNMLAQIDASPLKEELNKALITAEAAVRIACKKYGGQAFVPGAKGQHSAEGALWWMQKDLEEKKKRYGPSKANVIEWIITIKSKITTTNNNNNNNKSKPTTPPPPHLT